MRIKGLHNILIWQMAIGSLIRQNQCSILSQCETNVLMDKTVQSINLLSRAIGDTIRAKEPKGKREAVI